MRFVSAITASIPATLLLASTALAQSPVVADTDTVAVPRTPVTLGEVRVIAPPSQRGYGVARSRTATKTDTPLRDTPQAIGIVTKALIADQAMTTMADVVRYIPAVTMGQGEGHRDAPTIRGNSTTANFFVDGMRDDAQYLRDVYNVERVEALKGPGAMVFGRGSGGGVINRVTKQAGGPATHEISLEGGSYDHRRGSIDLGGSARGGLAARLNAMYEKSASYRDEVGLERLGIDPTIALTLGARTSLRAGYEHFVDTRTVDRGIPSLRGAPAVVPLGLFFGDPALNRSSARINAARVTLEHSTARRLTIRNASSFARYATSYQNIVPGAVMPSGTAVALSGYGHRIDRSNLFNQTDITYGAGTGALWHTLLVGAELGRQATGSVRRTAYFPGGGTVDTVPLTAPTSASGVLFRPSATDADNAAVATTASIYAQDQIAFSARWQALLGLRYERFAVGVDDRRDGSRLRRGDRMFTPRAGVVFKPGDPVSLYASYTISQLPSAGDQFSSVTITTRSLAPERFSNYEVGAKWDARANLSLTAAVYRLDRTNTSAKDPADPSRTVQTGAQRTSGFELGVVGAPAARWQVAGGYAAQRATIVSTTTAARAGATVPLVPRQSFSLWNRVDMSDAIGVGAGIIEQARSYAAIDNSVILPSFTRIDGALYLSLVPRVRAQVNVENVANVRYYPTSHGNNNILPGAPRTLRVSLATGF